MKFFQEITVWEAPYEVPNHIYYMKDDRSWTVGYIKSGTKKLIKFTRPMRTETRGRKFVQLDRQGEKDTVYFPKVEEEKPAIAVKTIVGSSGKKYFITGTSGRYSCSCPGFQFRHKCKHVEEMSS